MSLADVDLEEIKRRIAIAYDRESPHVMRFRHHARAIKKSIKRIRPYAVNAVSFVSADGGDNRLTFNPAVVELVRVVDSRGNQCALDAVSGNNTADDIDERGEHSHRCSVAPLARLCTDLGKRVSQLSYLLGGLGTDKSTGAMRTYRDIVEWAVLYDLTVGRDWRNDTILVRDGLLRTKSFRRDVFPEIDRRIRDAVGRHQNDSVNISIIGVAKQNAVLSRLSVALELEGVFHRRYPCYAPVPAEIEEECYNYDRTWLDTQDGILERNERLAPLEKRIPELYQSMGSLHLVKFGDRPYDPVWPVDIAVFQKHDTDRILGQLTEDAQRGFPIPDYPMSIQKAHDHAQIGGIEMSVLSDLLYQGLSLGLTKEEQTRLLRMRHLSENLVGARYKHG